jgi:CheY-like chemotaxis protein
MISEQDIHQAHILIVDDQQANVLLLEDMLAETGYTRIDSTMDPFTVVDLHRANDYDLILLDLQMPAMDGFEVMKQLKKIVIDDYLPVLVITAQPDHKLRALAAGAKDFIAKPFDIIEVNTRIRNMLEVRLLYKKLENYNQELEQTVLERTLALRDSEARYRSLIELASDWYWEQDAQGELIRFLGPVQQILGFDAESLASKQAPCEPQSADNTLQLESAERLSSGWNEVQRKELQVLIAARQPFLDYLLSRENTDGTQQQYLVSGEPTFSQSARYMGYRGFGVELIIPAVFNDSSR